MRNQTYVMLSCQFCERLERRVIWREGKPATCFECKAVRRAELTQIKRRAALALLGKAEAREAVTRETV